MSRKHFSTKRTRDELSAVTMEWACDQCTFLNKGTENACGVCNFKQKDVHDDVQVSQSKCANRYDEIKEQDSWTCTSCTLQNNTNINFCEACNTWRPSLNCLIQSNEIIDKVDVCHSPPVGKVFTDFSKRGPLPALPKTITIVSINVSGFQPSQEAPRDWDPILAFHELMLKESPDIIALQEVPHHGLDGNWLPGYVNVGTKPSHCENVLLLVKNEWAPHTIQIKKIDAPVVLVNIEFSTPQQQKSIIFGSCHLEPYKEGAAIRIAQLKKALDLCTKGDVIILAGDYNMRVKEDSKVEALGLKDAWKEAGSDKSHKNTWDSTKNRYHGIGAYQFTCRFDRIYLKGEMDVDDFHLIGDQPLTNPFHYLSDHFGMIAKIRIKND